MRSTVTRLKLFVTILSFVSKKEEEAIRYHDPFNLQDVPPNPKHYLNGSCVPCGCCLSPQADFGWVVHAELTHTLVPLGDG
jgi:hypothetical protein